MIDQIAVGIGLCGDIDEPSGYVCTLKAGSHDLHRCVTPSGDPEGICTGEWDGVGHRSGFDHGYPVASSDTTAASPVEMSDEMIARAEMRAAELSVSVDDEVTRWQENSYPDDLKLIAWAMHFREEVSVDVVAELLAMAVQKLASASPRAEEGT